MFFRPNEDGPYVRRPRENAPAAGLEVEVAARANGSNAAQVRVADTLTGIVGLAGTQIFIKRA